MTGSIATGFVESEEALHEEAVRIVGEDDFGDPGYLEGLRVLLDALDADRRLNESGRSTARYLVLDTLVQRLRCEQQWKRHPDVLTMEIERPIVICGLVRSGGTALHHLMAQDPALQSLPYWLATSPEPRPPRDEWPGHPGFERARAEIANLYAADPSLESIHAMRADGPEECRHLLMQTFTDDSFDVDFHVPAYSAWYRNADMLGPYRRHRDCLRLIGSTDPHRTWLLEYPVHMRFLRTLLEVYPDACVVQTHRDPLAVMPSYVDLVARFRGLNEDSIDRPDIARRQLEIWATGAEEAIELRRRRDSSQFYDLHCEDFLANPIDSVRRIYAHFDRPLTDAAEQAFRAWTAVHPRGEHGELTCPTALEDVGLTRSQILDRFAEYTEYFGLSTDTA